MNDIPTLEEVVEAIKKDRDYGPYVERLRRRTWNEDGSCDFDFDPLKDMADFAELMGDEELRASFEKERLKLDKLYPMPKRITHG